MMMVTQPTPRSWSPSWITNSAVYVPGASPSAATSQISSPVYRSGKLVPGGGGSMGALLEPAPLLGGMLL